MKRANEYGLSSLIYCLKKNLKDIIKFLKPHVSLSGFSNGKEFLQAGADVCPPSQCELSMIHISYLILIFCER